MADFVGLHFFQEAMTVIQYKDSKFNVKEKTNKPETAILM